ncbi:hypothetical protein WN51_00046 [Melipona quadrifasciata]|uniref:Uncharacterized protein n=1 Tax=Melipona quadrifasciata TaxID=166423 RepID=A0A0N0U2M1_9HYME|nr:hypothetical protein WN51_00046 [Melipona quadrifasciata]
MFSVLLLPRGYQGPCDPQVLPSEVSFQDPRDTVPNEVQFLFSLGRKETIGVTDISPIVERKNGVIRKS